MKRSLSFFLFLLPLFLFAQQGLTTFGLQIKPVIPLEYFDPLVEFQHSEFLRGSYELEGGRAFGMSIRAGLTKSITLETGITQIRRRYRWKVINDTAGFASESIVRWTGYEIPVRGLVYIRLGERTWMNNALGFSFDMYPTNVASSEIDAQAFIARQRWVQMAVEGNVGFEYRTPESGTVYVGLTYHRPFNTNAIGQLVWVTRQGLPITFQEDLIGTYLTLDLRYFFHEDPDRKRLRRGN